MPVQFQFGGLEKHLNVLHSFMFLFVYYYYCYSNIPILPIKIHAKPYLGDLIETLSSKLIPGP